MVQQKLAKHLIDLHSTEFDQTFNTMAVQQTNSQKSFFGFVDKNPLYADNSVDAIYECILSPRKRQHLYTSLSDENNEQTSRQVIADIIREGEK